MEVTYPEAYTGQRWVQSNPLNFDQKRQKITITADTDGLAPDDTYEAQVKIETLAGGINVPVQLTVIRPRPHFREIAIWFVPLLATVGAPAMITAIMGSAHRNLAPPAAASSLGLGLILLIITIASDVGIAERFCCAALMALMCCVLGSDTAAVNRFGYNGQLDSGMRAAAEIGLGFGALVVAQLFTARRWKVWCVILAAIGLETRNPVRHQAHHEKHVGGIRRHGGSMRNSSSGEKRGGGAPGFLSCSIRVCE